MPTSNDIVHQRNLLNTIRARVRVQRNQQQQMGTFTPAYIVNEIAEGQREIKRIKGWLVANGQTVEDAPEDGEEPAPPQPTANSPPSQGQQAQHSQQGHITPIPTAPHVTTPQRVRRDIAWWAALAGIFGLLVGAAAWLFPDPLRSLAPAPTPAASIPDQTPSTHSEPTSTEQPSAATISPTETAEPTAEPTNTPQPAQSPHDAAEPTQSPTNTPEPPPAVTTFRDDFDGRIRDEWMTRNAEYTVQDGKVAGTGTILVPMSHENVVIKVRSRGVFVAVFFRQAEPDYQDGYYIGITGKDPRFDDSQVATLYEVTSNQQRPRKMTLPESIDLSVFNDIEIVVQGKNATVNIGGTNVGTFVVGSYLEGGAVGVGFFPGGEVDYFEASVLP